MHAGESRARGTARTRHVTPARGTPGGDHAVASRTHTTTDSATDGAAEVVRWSGAAHEARPDALALEEPLELRLAGRALTVTMRTPGHDEELAAGLLYAQGLLTAATEIGAMSRDPRQPNRLDVTLAATLPGEERWRRYSYASSSCGLCGVESLEALALDYPPITAEPRVRAATLYGLPDRLRAAQRGFGVTGGVHAAALFSAGGDLLVAREDVGRHNAVDKVVGHALLRGLTPLEESVLLVSGRVSFEIVQKALAARLPLIAAVSAPTSLAVRVAEERGITLVGFLRGERMNVYSHARRVVE